MRTALIELARRPSRFFAAGGILTLIAILLMFIGGLLDGLIDSSTGAFRQQPGGLMAFSATANDSLPRSIIPLSVKDAVSSVPGVRAVGGIGTTQVAARPASTPDTRSLIPTIVIGYELPPTGLGGRSPGPGEVIADSAILARGVKVGDSIVLGAPRTPLKVVGTIDDSRFAGQISLWTTLETWHRVAETIRPGSGNPDMVQALTIDAEPPTDAMAGRIARAAGGTLDVLTLPAAIDALPGVATQRSTVNQIIGVTVLIALVVVALFFALITIERTTLYGVLKAMGASSGSLFLGVAAQAVVVTLAASLVAGLSSVALAVWIPPGTLPYTLSAQRIVLSVGLLLLAAIAGCTFSLRRVLRIDPAMAIGD